MLKTRLVRPALRRTVDRKGVIVRDGRRSCDGWRRQRCRAHIVREARYLREAHPGSAAARNILERLRRVYESASKKHTSRARAALLGRVRRVIDDNWGSGISRPFSTKLEGAADYLFGFVLDPKVSPTNNAAERGPREIVAPQDPRQPRSGERHGGLRQHLHVRRHVEEPGPGLHEGDAGVRVNGPKRREHLPIFYIVQELPLHSERV